MDRAKGQGTQRATSTSDDSDRQGGSPLPSKQPITVHHSGREVGQLAGGRTRVIADASGSERSAGQQCLHRPLAGDRVPCQELGQLMRGGLRALYVEELADALDGACLDVRERKRRKPAVSIQRRAVSAPVTDSTAWRSIAACSASKPTRPVPAARLRRRCRRLRARFLRRRELALLRRERGARPKRLKVSAPPAAPRLC